MSHELIQRNLDIYRKKHVDHKSYKEIANEYGISETRVRQILDQVRRSKLPQNLPVKQYVYEIEEACKFYNANATMRGRIYNALAAYGYLKRRKWFLLTEAEMRKMRNIGPMAIKIIKKAQEIPPF